MCAWLCALLVETHSCNYYFQLYLMDQLPHSSTQNPYPMKIVPKQERTESSDSNTDQHSNSEKSQPPQSPTDSDHIPSPERHQSSSSSHSSSNEAPFTPSMSVGTKEVSEHFLDLQTRDDIMSKVFLPAN